MLSNNVNALIYPWQNKEPAGGKSKAGEMNAMICSGDKSSWQTGTDPPGAATISVSNYYDTLHWTRSVIYQNTTLNMMMKKFY